MVFVVAGSGEEPPDVRGARGGGGAEGAHRRADGAHQPAGGGEHVPARARQPGHAGRHFTIESFVL